MAVINLHLNGELMDFMNEYIKRGYAASKAEVLRAGLRELIARTSNHEEDKRGWAALSQTNLRKLWNNPKDDKTWDKY